jgi:hypothetical protein
VSESILLTDTDVAAVHDAVALLDGWRAEARALPELASALGEPGVRALLLSTSDPTLLRSSIELAHARGVPVLVGCADEAARRRAVELKAEEWYQLPGTAKEISARVWSAVARGAALGSANAERVDRVEYEQMLHDSLTGLPTLPVAIERSRQLIKERGELVVLYFSFVRYS